MHLLLVRSPAEEANEAASVVCVRHGERNREECPIPPIRSRRARGRSVAMAFVSQHPSYVHQIRRSNHNLEERRGSLAVDKNAPSAA